MKRTFSQRDKLIARTARELMEQQGLDPKLKANWSRREEIEAQLRREWLRVFPECGHPLDMEDPSEVAL